MDTNSFIGRHAQGKKRPVAFPEAGEGAILSFDIADLEILEQEAEGGKWWERAMTALQETHIGHIKRLADLGCKGGDYAGALRTMPIADLSERLLDALTLSVFGRTAAEQEEVQVRREIEKQMRQMKLMQEVQNAAD